MSTSDDEKPVITAPGMTPGSSFSSAVRVRPLSCAGRSSLRWTLWLHCA